MKLKHLSLSVMLIGATSTVFASGYHFGTQSVSAQSTANASAAEASDASTIFYNAAGMTKLQGTNFSGALNLVAPSVKYSNAKGSYTGPVNATDPFGSRAPVAPIVGSDSGKLTDDVIAVPHLYLTHQLNDKVTAGLGVYVPFASKTEYQRDSRLRYNLNATELKTIDFNPTIAFKLNEQHSVAVGVIAQYAEAKLRQYSSFGGTGNSDGWADVKGDDWGFGYNLAWMWDINQQATVGLNYRSKIKHALEGDADWSFSSTAVQSAFDPRGYKDESAKIDITTPDSLSLHGMYKFDPKWTGYADVTWTRHSEFSRAELIYGNRKVVGVSGTTPLYSNTTYLNPNWENTYKIAVGGSYQYSEPLQLRAGIAFDKSPVPDAEHRLATMPDNDRWWFSFGANYKLNKQSSLDAAYSYIRIKDGSAVLNGTCQFNNGGQPCVSSQTVGSADYKAYANILGVQYNYRF